MKKICGKLLISLLILVPCLLISLEFNKVGASSNPFTVENVKPSLTSNDAIVDITESVDNSFKNTVTFHKVNDTASYIVTVKNNTEYDYVIKKIQDNNSNSYVTYIYDELDNKLVKANEEVEIKVKAIYNNPVNDINNREQDIESSLSLSYTAVSKLATLQRIEYFNQIVIIVSVILVGLISLVIYYLVQNNKINSETKFRNKIIFTVLLLGVIFIPYIVKALDFPFEIKISGKYFLNDQLLVDLNGIDKIVVPYNNTIEYLQEVPKTGYIFKGWKDEQGNIVDTNTPITEDIKLIPYYTLKTYRISYDLNGGSTNKNLKTSYTIKDKVSIPNPTKEGYAFLGWTGTNIDINKKDVVIPYGSIGTKSFKANFVPLEYKVEYELNGGVVESNPSTYTIEQELNLNSPVKTGYKFNGWIDNNKSINKILKGNIGNKTLVADYTPNKYTIIFDKNDIDAEGTMSKQVLIYDKEKELPKSTFTKEEYKFIGWSTTKEGEVEYTDEQPVLNILTEGEITLYAKYEKLLVGNFISGKEVNAKMKQLAGNSSATYNTNDSKIKIIKRSYELTESINTKNIVSTPDSDYPIYMWYENNTIYYYSESEQLYLTSDSSFFFNKLQSLNELDITTFNTYKVNDFSNMFSSMKSLKDLDLSNFKTKNATNMTAMFKESSFEKLNISSFKTSKVTSMNSMFWNLSKLTELNVKNLNTSSVEDMYGMFYQVSKITELDVSNFNTSNVKDMSSMFGNLYGLTELDLSSFNTSKVTKMENMFNGSSNIVKLNVTSFDTSNVLSMMRMFSSTKSIKELDLSSFDTSKANNMTKMFDNMNSLVTIYVSDKFVVNNNTKGDRMFANDINLVGGNGTIYNENKMNKEYAKIDEMERPGYFTKKEDQE